MSIKLRTYKIMETYAWISAPTLGDTSLAQFPETPSNATRYYGWTNEREERYIRDVRWKRDPAASLRYRAIREPHGTRIFRFFCQRQPRKLRTRGFFVQPRFKSRLEFANHANKAEAFCSDWSANWRVVTMPLRGVARQIGLTQKQTAWNAYKYAAPSSEERMHTRCTLSACVCIFKATLTKYNICCSSRMLVRWKRKICRDKLVNTGRN